MPSVGTAASQVATLAAEPLLQRPTWDVAFAQAAARLSHLGIPVLIVIDDVDRLQRTELATLLKVVRLLGRFPGVTYLLAYDEQTLLSNLQASDMGIRTRVEARLFMEKIVQFPITVPPLLPSQVIGRLNEGIDEIVASGDCPGPIEDHRLSGVADVLLSQLTTPRAIHRFLAQSRITLSMHAVNEIDPVDVMLLTLVRLQFPDLYAELPRWRVRLTGGQTAKDWSTGRPTSPDFSPLLQLVPETSDRDDARELLEALFPAITSRSSGSGSRQRVSHADYFNRYFVHSVPADDIADTDLDDVLTQLGSADQGHDLLAALVSEGPDGRIDLALRRLHARWTERRHELDPLATLAGLMSVWSTVPTPQGALFGGAERVTYWAADVVMSTPPNTSWADLLSCVDHCPDLDGPIHVLWATRGSEKDLTAPVVAVAHELADRCLDEVLAHLRAGDDAPLSVAAYFRLLFIRENGDVEVARTRIQSALRAGGSIEDLAARCTTVAHMVGVADSSRISDFDQEVFAAFAPAEDPLYQRSLEHPFDDRDISWANRRRYARGRAKSPAESAGRAPAEPDPVTD